MSVNVKSRIIKVEDQIFSSASFSDTILYSNLLHKTGLDVRLVIRPDIRSAHTDNRVKINKCCCYHMIAIQAGVI